VRPDLPAVGQLSRDPAPPDLAALARSLPRPARGHRFPSIQSIHEAYRAGDLTPLDVAERLTAAMADAEAADPPLRAIIDAHADDLRDQAAASAARWAAGTPLGPLDGVPVAVKDELDQAGYRTRVGTSFLGAEPAAHDATVVARLRAQGALLFGKANMHEIGIGTTGLNVHFGTPRNPYDPSRHTGGSSSGSAAAVGAGLCPLAVGADGGGSIRIPAALCGVYGLKATFGRISEHGAAPLCWSVAHVGPIAANAADLALGYAVMAGVDPHDANTAAQPSLDLRALEADTVDGLRLGVYRPWFNDASPDVVARCDALLSALVERGAVLVDVDVPELDAVRLAHTTTIVSEMYSALAQHHARDRHRFSLEVRVNLALAQRFTAADYLAAQRIRTRVTGHMRQLFGTCDLLITPTTGIAAPAIHADALADGESNITTVGQIMRFAPLANLTGYPAVSVPAGYDGDGLPVGLQAMGPPWSERRLLALALATEALVERRPPARLHAPI
jgi:Asp-tRNA(Asn)/Glu-tRNA(Gln) amidotransferase A subunit family amidase